MIVVLGSCHDPVARHLVSAWPNAALCSAEDLTRSGWVLSSDDAATPRWVIDGTCVADSEITGVFIRRSTVYPEELLTTHPADRGYLAAETHAFLIAMLCASRALVANPVRDGGMGDDTLRPERWIAAALDLNLPIAPLRVAEPRRQSLRQTRSVEVVRDEVHASLPLKTKRGLVQLVRMLDLHWASVLLDRRNRLVGLTTALPPSDRAISSLRMLLQEGCA